MLDVNALKSRLAELKVQEAMILSDLQQQQNELVCNLSALITDRESLQTLVDSINPIAAPLGLMVVVRKQGAERKKKGVDPLESVEVEQEF